MIPTCVHCDLPESPESPFLPVLDYRQQTWHIGCALIALSRYHSDRRLLLAMTPTLLEPAVAVVEIPARKRRKAA